MKAGAAEVPGAPPLVHLPSLIEITVLILVILSTMAVPKRKMSRSNTRSRRANYKATPVALVSVSTPAGTAYVPRRLVRAVQRGLIDATPYVR